MKSIIRDKIEDSLAREKQKKIDRLANYKYRKSRVGLPKGRSGKYAPKKG